MAAMMASMLARRMMLAGIVIGGAIAVIAYGWAQSSLDVVYVPTPQETANRMLELAAVGPRDYVIDLGSGDGRIAIAAGRRGARALGVELDPDRLREAEANLKRAGVANRVSFRRQNLFETDLSGATVLTMYLLPSINVKLRPKILDLRPGTRVVSHDFAMGDWRPDVTETVNWRIHFWIVPAKVAGAWTVAWGSQRFGIALTQAFQDIKGTATIGGRAVALSNARLRGSTIEFTINVSGQAVRFSGVIDGDGMTGAASSGGGWTARR